jgi:hypothetical protein
MNDQEKALAALLPEAMAGVIVPPDWYLTAMIAARLYASGVRVAPSPTEVLTHDPTRCEACQQVGAPCGAALRVAPSPDAPTGYLPGMKYGTGGNLIPSPDAPGTGLREAAAWALGYIADPEGLAHERENVSARLRAALAASGDTPRDGLGVRVPIGTVAALMEGQERVSEGLDRLAVRVGAASRVVGAVKAWSATPGRDRRAMAAAERAMLDTLTDYEAAMASDLAREYAALASESPKEPTRGK